MSEEKQLDWDALYREWRVTQEMLAMVLNMTGPVLIPKAAMQIGLPQGAGIVITDDRARDAIVISLEGGND